MTQIRQLMTIKVTHIYYGFTIDNLIDIEREQMCFKRFFLNARREFLFFQTTLGGCRVHIHKNNHSFVS